MGLSNGLNKKTAALVAISLLLIPFFSYAAIPVANPNNTFADVDFTKVVLNIANWIIAFIGILGIIFLVYGGILYVTSGGDESRAEDGKRTITYAILGLFLAASAYAIEKLILVTFVS